MPNLIHPTAIISETVKFGNNVKIGPFCTVTGDVELQDDVELISHISITGRTKIGKETKIYPFCSIGHPPQDLKYRDEPSVVVIGSYNVIREYVTIQPGTRGGIMKTQVGDHCLLMASSHIAHDCIVGDKVILANNATLAGHVTIKDKVLIGGLSAIHQFVSIGKGAIIGGMSGVEHNVIPYGSVKGERANLNGLNFIGLKRGGVERSELESLRNAYKILFSNKNTLAERVHLVAQNFQDNEKVIEIIDFIKADSTRSLCMPKDHESF